jgi:Trp operon repressor
MASSKKGKLNVARVRRIKQLLAEGKPQAKIANTCNVSQVMISHIKTGKAWKSVSL